MNFIEFWSTTIISLLFPVEKQIDNQQGYIKQGCIKSEKIITFDDYNAMCNSIYEEIK